MNSAFASPRSLLLAVCCLALAACSGKPEPSTPAKPEPSATVKPTSEAAPASANPVVPPVTSTDADAAAMPPAPRVSEDPKDHPGFKVETLEPGTGKEVVVGKKVKVRYAGTLLNGREFDSSWQRGVEPAEFPLDGVVPGFRMGLLGMKVGEHRRITIPGELGYGVAGSPVGRIGSNETLIFDVELVDVVD